ncbi:MAG: hypothetical protein ACE5NW_18060, partial [Acidiferrobacterales bacterium]
EFAHFLQVLKVGRAAALDMPDMPAPYRLSLPVLEPDPGNERFQVASLPPFQFLKTYHLLVTIQ